jgi:hypothetical protein
LIKPNIKDYISYHLGGNQGAAFNAYELHKLKPKGQFWNNGGVYDAWYTRGEAKAIMPQLPARKLALLTDSSTGYSTGYETEGEVDGKNTPLESEPVTVVTAPVMGGATRENEPVTAPVTPLLIGAPVTVQDKSKVRNIYAVTGSKSETCRLVWGGKNGQRMQWLNEILQEGEVLQ